MDVNSPDMVVVSGAGTGIGRAVARRLTGDGLHVLAPGFVPDTGFWAGRLTGESRRQRAAQTLVGREGTPEEVASLIAWLLGPDGGWVTGQVLSPNGGVVLGR
jgi:3-oxoacyl-[acyl-carrier protein] reductase